MTNEFTADEVLQELARRHPLDFAEYIMPDFKDTQFHQNYYRILDLFAHGEIQNLIVQCPPQHGKALKTDTPVLTTEGWKAHGDLKVGDYVIGDDGKPKMVQWVSGSYEWQTQRISFADGFSIIAAREHEWQIYADHDDRKGRVLEQVETQDIFKRRHRRSPYIMADAVLELPERELPIDPYLFGLWLGNGNKSNGGISYGAQDIDHYKDAATTIRRDRSAYRLNYEGLAHKLRLLGVKDNKHIPTEYLLSSERQRRELLSGLMDTDGYACEERGMCEFCQKKGQLADDVYVLLRSLGYKPTRHEYKATLYGKDCGIKVRIMFAPDKGEQIFKLPRKQARIDGKTRADRNDKKKFFITGVEDTDLCLVNCIQVEGGMYLAGHELVPTHNSQGSSRILPAYMLGLNPNLKIAICSYAATIAKDFNRDVQRIIDSEEYHKIFPDTCLSGSNVVTVSDRYLRNSDVFEIVDHIGSLRVVGRGGSLTSKTVDVMILDDLYKDSQEANSPVVRESAWDWYTKVARTRLHNDSQQLIVFTRWHPEDIIGRIIESEEVIKAERWADFDNVPHGAWVLVNFEAIKTGEPTELDPRSEGEPLWGERHSLERLRQQQELDPVGFQCLFQGDPGTAEGRLFAPFKTWVQREDYGTYVRSGCYVDVADEGDDYLCAISYDIVRSESQIYNEQTRRFEPLLFALVTDVVYTDEPTDVTVITVSRLINSNNVQKAWIESNNGGSQFAKNVMKRVRAQVVPFYQSDNKEARIVTNAPFINQQVVMPFGWETRYQKAYDHLTGFLRNFAANKHDDLEDALCGVFLKELSQGNAQPYGAMSRGIKVH